MGAPDPYFVEGVVSVKGGLWTGKSHCSIWPRRWESPRGRSNIRAGSVLASIYQRAYTQGRMAFRVLYEFLVEGSCPAYQVTLAPHLVMRANLDFFLQRQSLESKTDKEGRLSIDAAELEGYSVG